jgi:sec-independent protein translocase protein TatA
MLAAGPFGLGPMELVIILLVLVMLFGATRLADLGGSLGKGIKEFRKEVSNEDEEAPPPAAQASTANGNGAGVVSAIKCASCGTLNDASAKHCNQCGAALAAPVT